MSNKLVKSLIIIFSVIFAVRVITIFAADRCYSMSLSAEPIRGIGLINIAEKLDSTNANLYFTEYKILEAKIQREKAKDNAIKITDNKQYRKEQLHLLKRAIELCPSWPAYHLYYAFTLRQMAPRPNILTATRILEQFKASVDLKPFSKSYRKIYDRDNKKFIKQYSTSKIKG